MGRAGDEYLQLGQAVPAEAQSENECAKVKEKDDKLNTATRVSTKRGRA